MNIRVIGKNEKITQPMNEAVKTKLKVLEKFIGDENVSVVVTARKGNQVVSVKTIYDSTFVEVEKTGEDFYCVVDEIVDVMKVKMDRLSKKKQKRQKDQERALQQEAINIVENEDADEITTTFKVTKYKKFVLKPMLEEEAICQMESLGHDAYIFKNAEKDDTICMIYRRADGKYGLIETE